MDPTSGQSSITVVFFVVGKGSARRQPSILHVQACIGRWMWQLLWMNPLFCGKRCADKSSGNTSYFIWCSMPLLCKGIDLEAINWDVSSILVGMEDCFWFWNIRLTYLGLFWNFQPSNDRFEKPKQQLCTTTGEPTMTSASRKDLPRVVMAKFCDIFCGFFRNFDVKSHAVTNFQA